MNYSLAFFFSFKKNNSLDLKDSWTVVCTQIQKKAHEKLLKTEHQGHKQADLLSAVFLWCKQG